MTTPPGADEARTRRALDHLGVSYAPTTPPPPPPDWQYTAPAPGPDTVIRHEHHIVDPPEAPEARWDWRRLRHWPHHRLTLGVCAALAPVFGGQSATTGWGRALRQCRVQASVGGAWTLAGLALLVAVTAARWRPRWYTRALVVVALFGAAAQASPLDLVQLVTGAP